MTYKVVFSLVLMVAAAFFASAATTASSSHLELRSALSTRGHEEDGGGGGGGVGERSRQRRTWPCCDRCGGCTKSTPPQCQCQDMVRSCHPSCRHCVRSPLSVSPPLYQCMDRIPNYCRRRCTPEPLLAQ